MGEGAGGPSPAELLQVAVEAVSAAGAVLRDGLGRPKQIEAKNERTSIVTWADTTAQETILQVIRAHYPRHAVLAEEGGDVRAAGAADGPTWLVDPLDGTSNYAHGIPFACTSVGVRDAAGPVAGAILEPFRGELFTAVRGGGAWLGDERLRVSQTADLARALVCTGVQSDDPEAIGDFARRVEQLVLHARGVRCIGSPALCLAYIAAGRIDGFLERDSTYAWDFGAGALLVSEAGGRVEDLDGGPLNLGPGIANVLATNGAIHDELADLVRVGTRRQWG
jgi:myo-inositol-1(or 4)-monophosphatase